MMYVTSALAAMRFKARALYLLHHCLDRGDVPRHTSRMPVSRTPRTVLVRPASKSTRVGELIPFGRAFSPSFRGAGWSV
jgi:hypothetical protein